MSQQFRELLRAVLKTTPLKRKAFFLIFDSILIMLSVYVSFWLRFEGKIPPNYVRSLEFFIFVALIIKIFFLSCFSFYSISWRFFSLRDLIRLVKAITIATLTIGLLLFLLRPYPPFSGFPRSIIFMDYIISIVFIGALRISKRVILEHTLSPKRKNEGNKRVLIIGAGSAGEQIAREMLTNNKSSYFPVGYIDDDAAKKGIRIHGLKVLGLRDDMPDVLRSQQIDEVLVAIPSASSKEIRKIVEIARKSGELKKIKILPSITEVIDGRVTLSDIKEVRIEDLLGRDPVAIDFGVIRDFLSGKKVLITGAGGSIGSELSKRVVKFEPRAIGLLDIDETALFLLLPKLKSASSEIVPIIGDITDQKKMKFVFDKFKPDILLHSAAYKHVPMLEYCPEVALKTNVLGTKILAELAIENAVERFVYISTDKAINPTSVMGSTKRVGEELMRVFNNKNRTRFISVRFGNVLGSRGSVSQIFQQQIQQGGPVTITHPEMKRYFMAPSEAVLLVLEAAARGEGGEAYVLDMGDPVKIVDLAKEMIRLSGYEPDVNIPIVFTGLRPGEKLFEEILGAEEGSEPTGHPKIYRVRSSKKREEKEFLTKIDELIALSSGNAGRDEILACLQEIVPTFKPTRELKPLTEW